MKYINLCILSVLVSTTIMAQSNQGISFYKAGFPDVAKSLLISDLKSDQASKADIYYYLGNTYYLENQADSAAYCYNQGVQVDPMNPLNAVGLIMLKMKTQDPITVETDITNIIKDKKNKKNKKNINLYIAVSYAYLYNDFKDKALQYAAKAKSINSKNPDVYILNGDIIVKDNLGAACNFYETASFYDKNCIQAYIKYARAYKNANPKFAIDKLNKLKEIDPSFVLADRELGDVYYAINDFDKAAVYYDNYLKSGNKTNLSDLVRYSMTLFLKHDFAKSIEVAKMGMDKYPENPALIRMMLYNNVDLKNYDLALNAADMLFNKSKDANITYLDHRYYGQALKETSKFEQAISEYQKAISFDTTKIDLWKDMSDMYVELKDYPNAISTYTAFKNKSEKDSKSVDMSISLAKLYYSYGMDTLKNNIAENRKLTLLKADSIFNQVTIDKPEDYRGNFWRARTNAALDPQTTLGLAKPYYEKTAAFVEEKKDPRYNSVLTECYSYMGYYYFVQGNNKVSLDYWNKILTLDPNNATAKKAIAGIQSIKPKK